LLYDKLLETHNFSLQISSGFQHCIHCLLFEQIIDINRDCTIYIIDNWLCIELDNKTSPETVITVIHQLRLMFRNLLNKKLIHSLNQIPNTPVPPSSLLDDELFSLPQYISRIRQESQQENIICSSSDLSGKLAEFLEYPLGFKLRRLKHSELMIIFGKEEPKKEESTEDMDPMQALELAQNAQTESFENSKGGIKINSYLRWGSITETQNISASFSKYLKKHYHCQTCGKDFIFNVDDLTNHNQECSKISSTMETTQQEQTIFKCDKCGRVVESAIKLLKHKKIH